MKLRGIDFGRVWGASGVQGFFGEGYWFHSLFRPVGLDFKGMTFVAKTTTLDKRAGNMPLDQDFRPRQLFPGCVIVKFRSGITLNSVGLSGPGAGPLFNRGLWQARRESFLLSFMSVAQSREQRLEELRGFVALFNSHRRMFRGPVGLQINYSCPNVGLHVDELVREVADGLDAASVLGIPLVPKFNVVFPVEAARDISTCPSCDGLCITNTIPWGQLPDKIDWSSLFGSVESPLKHLGGGGLGGRPLLPLLMSWLRDAREVGITKPINAGGGILSAADGQAVLWGGANSIFLGSVAMLRPWRVRGIIHYLNGRG